VPWYSILIKSERCFFVPFAHSGGATLYVWRRRGAWPRVLRCSLSVIPLRLQPGRRTVLALVFPSRVGSMSKVRRSPFFILSGSMPAFCRAMMCRKTSGPPSAFRMNAITALGVPHFQGAGAHLVLPSPSAPALHDDAYSRWSFACLWLTGSVSISGRSKLCPFSSRATPKVARPLRTSMWRLASARHLTAGRASTR
jgi:hypothetical protein